ncbi:MAG: hypothetical protein ACXW4T_00285 [Candidatus Limnocylindrales bacterium]
MSESFGLGDGMNDLGHVRAIAESKAADARLAPHHDVDAGRWPTGVTVGRVLIGILGAVVVGGWILTALNGGA